MLIGSKIAEQRKRLGISQTELAKDICTQATLSKMEQKNIAPMTETLVKICCRLGLTVNDVLSEFNEGPQTMQAQTLEKVKTALNRYHFNDAKQLFGQIKLTELATALVSEYRCVKARIEMAIDNQADEALFDLGIAIQSANNEQDLMAASAAFGTAYAIKGEKEKASYYFTKAITYADTLTLDQNNVGDYMQALNNAAKFYSDEKEYDQSNQINDKIILTIQAVNVLPYYDQSCYRTAFNLYQLDKNRNAKKINEYLETATVLAKLSNNQLLLEHIENFRQNGLS